MKGVYILINNWKKDLRGWFFLKPQYVHLCKMMEVLSSFFSEGQLLHVPFERQNYCNYRVVI